MGICERTNGTRLWKNFENDVIDVLVSVNVLRKGRCAHGRWNHSIAEGLEKDKHEPMRTQMIGRGLRGPRSGGTEHCTIWQIE